MLSLRIAVISQALLGSIAMSQTYVDPLAGNDNNSGAITSPVKTLHRARNLVRIALPHLPTNASYTVYLRGGVYDLFNPETGQREALKLGAFDSTATHAVYWGAYSPDGVTYEHVLMTGGQRITNWVMGGLVPDPPAQPQYRWWGAYVDWLQPDLTQQRSEPGGVLRQL